MSLNQSLTVVTGGAGLLGTAFVEAILENDGLCVIGELNKEKANLLAKTLSKKFGEKKSYGHKS